MKKRHLKTVGLVGGCGAAVVLAAPTPFSLLAGGSIVAAGEIIRLWATGHLVRNREVTTSGPYAFVRDPLYLGRLFLIVGFCVMGWGYCLLLLPVGLGVFFMSYLPRKYRKEMTRLEKLYGETYRNYAAQVKSLVPRLRPYAQARPRPWSFRTLWCENREQYFVLIVLSVFIAMLLKYRGLL